MAGALEEPQIDEKVYLELTDGLKWELPDLLMDVKDPLDGFQKKEYEKTFLEYIGTHSQVLRDLEDAYQYGNEKEEMLRTLAEDFVGAVKKSIEEEPKKRKRSKRLTDYNLILAAYLFPALLKENPHSGEIFAEELRKAWKQAFPRTNLNISTYEEIEEGFRQRYCYISTAVCQSLNKGDDCEELVLLRNYRDGYLTELSNGKDVIREYYDVAPTIVKHINRRSDAPEIYRGIYKDYLEKCIRLIREGKNEQCRKVYTDMVYSLEEKYFS